MTDLLLGACHAGTPGACSLRLLCPVHPKPLTAKAQRCKYVDEPRTPAKAWPNQIYAPFVPNPISTPRPTANHTPPTHAEHLPPNHPNLSTPTQSEKPTTPASNEHRTKPHSPTILPSQIPIATLCVPFPLKKNGRHLHPLSHPSRHQHQTTCVHAATPFRNE
jgi:hypothetical protein